MLFSSNQQHQKRWSFLINTMKRVRLGVPSLVLALVCVSDCVVLQGCVECPVRVQRVPGEGRPPAIRAHGLRAFYLSPIRPRHGFLLQPSQQGQYETTDKGQLLEATACKGEFHSVLTQSCWNFPA